MPANRDASFVDDLAQNVAVLFLDRVETSPQAEAKKGRTSLTGPPVSHLT